MSISVKPFSGVRITIPMSYSFYHGEKLAREKIGWIETHLSRIKSLQNEYLPGIDNGAIVIRNHIIQFIPAAIRKITYRMRKRLMVVKYPAELEIQSEEVQKSAAKAIEKVYREEAAEYLSKRLNDLSDKYNLPFNELYIKNIKSRWGSCSGKNNINLSIHLMRLPDHLIDYVILHELAHTKVKDHSKNFWRFLGTLSGEAKALDKELKKFRIN